MTKNALPRPFNSSGHQLRGDVQGLRGVAVLLVVLYHAGVPFLPGGFVGVDVFFVISGYLITGLLVRELYATGRINLPRFFARRALRLLPAAVVLILCTALITVWLLPPLEQREIVSSARASLVYLANFWFADRAVDYLGGDSQSNPLLHMWSLAVEEQFYILWPFMLAGLGAVSFGHVRRILPMALILVFVASWLACLWMTSRTQPQAFFGMPFRGWEFAAGGLVYFLSPTKLAQRWQSARWIGWAGLLTIAASAALLTEQADFPGPWATAPVLGTAAVILSLELRATQLSTWLSAAPIARLGDLSYSWYLWHWPVLVLGSAAWPESGALGTTASIALSLAIAALSLHAVENPIRHSSRLSTRPGLVLMAMGAISLALAGLSTGLLVHLDRRELSPFERVLDAARGDRKYLTDPRCHANFEEVEIGECAFGSTASDKTVVVTGDSHAVHWFPALDKLAKQHNFRLISLTKTGCPSVDLDVYLAKYRRPYTECSEWRRRVVDRIATLHPAMVILSNSSAYALPESAWRNGTQRTVDLIERSGATVLMLRDIPVPGFDVPQCLARAQWRNLDIERSCRFSLQKARGMVTSLDRHEDLLLAGSVRSFGVDLSAEFCRGDDCATYQDGRVRYSDSNHLTASFSAHLSSAFEAGVIQAASLRKNALALAIFDK